MSFEGFDDREKEIILKNSERQPCKIRSQEK